MDKYDKIISKIFINMIKMKIEKDDRKLLEEIKKENRQCKECGSKLNPDRFLYCHQCIEKFLKF